MIRAFFEGCGGVFGRCLGDEVFWSAFKMVSEDEVLYKTI